MKSYDSQSLGLGPGSRFEGNPPGKRDCRPTFQVYPVIRGSTVNPLSSHLEVEVDVVKRYCHGQPSNTGLFSKLAASGFATVLGGLGT